MTENDTAAVPGWKLVPVKPTKAMLEEAEYNPDHLVPCGVDGTSYDFRKVWSAMLAASPSPPSPGAGLIEAIARLVAPPAWADHDYWASRLRGEGHWPDDAKQVSVMRESYERRMPFRVAPSIETAQAILTLTARPAAPVQSDDALREAAQHWLTFKEEFLAERRAWPSKSIDAMQALNRLLPLVQS